MHTKRVEVSYLFDSHSSRQAGGRSYWSLCGCQPGRYGSAGPCCAVQNALVPGSPDPSSYPLRTNSSAQSDLQIKLKQFYHM